MKVRVGKSEGGLTLPIPQELIDDLKLFEGSSVELLATPGRITVRSEFPTLEELVAGITPENLHVEFDGAS